MGRAAVVVMALVATIGASGGPGQQGAVAGPPSDAHATPRVGSRRTVSDLTPERRAEIERTQHAWQAAQDALAHSRRLLLEGDDRAAETACRRALALAPRGAASSTAFGNVEAHRLLGRVLVREGRYREGLPMLLVGHQNVVSNGDDPDIAIACCRLGDYQHAKRFCSGGGLIPPRMKGMPVRADVPGTATLAATEASALLARGLEALGTAHPMQAHPDFLAAEKCAPGNVFVAYVLGRSFAYDLQDGRQAWSRFKLVAARGHEPIRSEAKRQLEGLKAWFRIHPEQAPPDYHPSPR